MHAGITLYIAGHTDTVGSPTHNFKLSQDRARSIASWFRKRGVDPDLVQGFGETSLAVKTADNIDEVRTAAPTTSCPTARPRSRPPSPVLEADPVAVVTRLRWRKLRDDPFGSTPEVVPLICVDDIRGWGIRFWHTAPESPTRPFARPSGLHPRSPFPFAGPASTCLAKAPDPLLARTFSNHSLQIILCTEESNRHYCNRRLPTAHGRSGEVTRWKRTRWLLFIGSSWRAGRARRRSPKTLQLHRGPKVRRERVQSNRTPTQAALPPAIETGEGLQRVAAGFDDVLGDLAAQGERVDAVEVVVAVDVAHLAPPLLVL